MTVVKARVEEARALLRNEGRGGMGDLGQLAWGPGKETSGLPPLTHLPPPLAT